jgi:hypothetical protein
VEIGNKIDGSSLLSAIRVVSNRRFSCRFRYSSSRHRSKTISVSIISLAAAIHLPGRTTCHEEDTNPMVLDIYDVFRLCPEHDCSQYSLTECGLSAYRESCFHRDQRQASRHPCQRQRPLSKTSSWIPHVGRMSLATIKFQVYFPEDFQW